MATADLVLFLVSADFIRSDYIWSHELDVAMRRHKCGEASVVPVMLRAVDIVDASLAALARIASDQEPFDLVLSVWQRPEPIAGAPSAGIRLLRELRARHLTIPVVFYHGSSDERERSAR